MPGVQLPTPGPTATVTRLQNKVPQVLAVFWITKALTTAFGESTSDFLVHAISPVPAVLLGFVAFCIALAVQLRAARYDAARYWFPVGWSACSGPWPRTCCTQVSGSRTGLGRVLRVVLAAVFVGWYRVEGTLSVHSIVTTRRELFYWAAVVATSRSALRRATSPRTPWARAISRPRCSSRRSSPCPHSGTGSAG